MICDGIVQCNDGEDEGEHCSHITGETEENCSGMWCPLKSFNKDGCVAITSVCDGDAQVSFPDGTKIPDFPLILRLNI